MSFKREDYKEVKEKYYLRVVERITKTSIRLLKRGEPMKVYIEDIADKMEEANEELQTFLNRNTGEIVDVGQEYYRIAEKMREDEEIPAHLREWEKELVQTALEIEENWGDYEELPNQYDIHEYSIMEDFIERITDNRKSAILYRAINGAGAFRRFKDKLFDLGLEESWFSYKHEAYCKIAKRWCEESGISYEYKNRKEI